MITVGIDVGSLFVKGVVLRGEDVAARRIARTSGVVGNELPPFLDALLADAGTTRAEVTTVGATGNGADLVVDADFIEDEVTCAASAAAYLVAGVHRTIHIGGQSIAAIVVDEDGVVEDFIRNDKCAAGTGRFLEMMCRKLGVPIDEVDAIAARAAQASQISDQCVVFAESEVIGRLNDGEPPENIVAGICASLARIVVAQGRRFRGVTPYTLTGGVARFAAVVDPICERLDGEYRPFPADPRLAAALGAALLEEDPDDGPA
jgi:(R)-2-hydroxyacyl-CoA dehydratese activating ATPase